MSSLDQDLFFEFGRLVAIRTDKDGDIIKVDGNEVGVSPIRVDLPYGRHTIHAERDDKYADKTIEVIKGGGETEHYLVLHSETVGHFVKNGVNFVTINGAYEIKGIPSYGVSFGSVKRIGWFVSAMSNFDFDAMNYSKTAYSGGLVDGVYPYYFGDLHYTRISAMGGLMVKIGGPVCLRVGVGYGACVVCQYTMDGDLINIKKYSNEGVDASIGLQLNLKGFTMSAEAVTTNFGTTEVKMGLGYCWRKHNGK